MSSTRTASPGSPLHQERWASCGAFQRGIKANLVALRCSVIEAEDVRELVWFLQWLSLQPGGFPSAATALGVSEDSLAELCLNPESDLRPFLPGLRKLLDDHRQAKAQGVVVTEIGQAIADALAYCQHSRGLVVVSGLPRIGKTWAVERYCEQHPGLVRYVQVPSSADDLAFFMAIARALGVTVESVPKTKQLRPRIEAALQGGDLALILDEASNLWPGHNYRLARPSRICWLMTALVNRRVPVACIAAPQFFKAQQGYERKSGWTSEQWRGRVERTVNLPETVCDRDLERIARLHLPAGDRRSIETLVDYARLSKAKRLAAIEHCVKLARHFADKRGEISPEWIDVNRAVNESIATADPELAAALKRVGCPPGGHAGIPRPQRAPSAVEGSWTRYGETFGSNLVGGPNLDQALNS